MRVFERIANQNFLMIIYVKARDLRFPIVIPIPLAVVEDIVDATVQIFRIVAKLVPGLEKNMRLFKFGHFQVRLDDLLDLPVLFIHELRKTGRYTLVEVKDDEAHVFIKLY